MNEVEPHHRVRVDGALGMTEDRLPPWREVNPVGLQVPIPDSVIRRPHRQRVALLAPSQVADRLLVVDRVANRALEARRLELVLDQIVGHPQGTGFEIDPVVALTGEDDHRRQGARGEALADQV